VEWKSCAVWLTVVVLGGCGGDHGAAPSDAADQTSPRIDVTAQSEATFVPPPLGTAVGDDRESIVFEGLEFVCDEAVFGYDRYDCVRARGEVTSSNGLAPDLYCNGVSTYPSCSDQWYPDGLEEFKQITFDSEVYICEERSFPSGDLDCYSYTGGDPAHATSAYSPDLYCSGRLEIDCNDDYYPSEADGLTFVSIGGGDYVCEDTMQGDACYEWDGAGSPRDAVDFSYEPDYYCRLGDCRQDGYP
jgi:hypothetical protein